MREDEERSLYVGKGGEARIVRKYICVVLVRSNALKGFVLFMRGSGLGGVVAGEG